MTALCLCIGLLVLLVGMLGGYTLGYHGGWRDRAKAIAGKKAVPRSDRKRRANLGLVQR